MSKRIKCTCGQCRVCRQRTKRRGIDPESYLSQSKINISSSLSLFEINNFYLGHPPPKCGRVAPKPAS